VRAAVNALHLVPGETGGSEVYVRRLIPALLAADPELELEVFASREGYPALQADGWDPRARVHRLPVNARSRVARVIAEQTLLPLAVRRSGADLLHNMFTTAPAIAPVPQVSTIHDVIYKRHPEAHAGVLTRGMEVLVPLAARRSTRILAVSRATADDLVELLGIDSAKIDVAPNGPGMSDSVVPVPEARLREELALGDRPLVLTVAPRRGHKNVDRLLEAFELVEASPEPLLLVPGYDVANGADAVANERVRFLGWVDDATLDGLYRAAACFVFPSLAEGFGLPVLEAMRRGAPVACSDRTSLPEVAGDAALYFDPTSARSIADAIERLLGDRELAARLTSAGELQAAKFTWEACAADTLASYERALAARR